MPAPAPDAPASPAPPPAGALGLRLARGALPRWAAPALVGTGVFLGARLGYALLLPGGVAALWPANSVLLTGLLRLPRRRWPGLLLAAAAGQCLAAVGAHTTLETAALLALVNGGESLLAASILRRFAGGTRIEAPMRLVRLLLVAGLVPLVSGLPGAAVLAAGGAAGPFWRGWLQWSFSGATGAVTLTPALVLATGPHRVRMWRSLRARWPEALILGVALALCTWAGLESGVLGPHAQLAMAALPVPALLWAASRFGLRGTAFACAAYALLASGLSTAGVGALVAGGLLAGFWFQGLLLMVTLPQLVLGATTSARDRAAQALAAARRRLDRDVRLRTAELAEKVEQLRRTHEQQDALLRTMVSGVVTVAPDGRITFANRAAEEILELRRDALLERRYEDRAFRQVDEHGEALPPHRLPLARALAERREVRGAEHGVVRDDGTVTWLFVNAAPLRDDGGALLGAVASFSDVTARWKAQQEIVRSRDLAELAQRQADAAGRATSELLVRLAHDLRSPLSVILNYAQVLEQAAQLTPREGKAARAIHLAGVQLSQLLEDALDLARVEAGQAELTPEPAGVEELVAGALARPAELARARGVALERRIEPGVPAAWRVDRRRFGRVLEHLVQQALRSDAVGPVEVRLAPSRAPGVVRVAVVDAGEHVPPPGCRRRAAWRAAGWASPSPAGSAR
ncbi:MAG: MASE1 domain-containing protein [Anaeromyxobacter sp.]